MKNMPFGAFIFDAEAPPAPPPPRPTYRSGPLAERPTAAGYGEGAWLNTDISRLDYSTGRSWIEGIGGGSGSSGGSGGLTVPAEGRVVVVSGDLSNVVSPWDGGNLLFDPAGFIDPFGETPSIPGAPPAGWSISEDGYYVQFPTDTWFHAVLRLQVNMT